MKIGAFIPAILVVTAAACTEQPDLAPVEADLAPGTAGIGGTRISESLADDPFGERIAQAVVTNPDIARTAARVRTAQAEETAADGAFKPDLSVGVNAEARSVAGNSVSNASPFLRVSQLVYDGGAARADQTAAQARVLQSRGEQLEAASAATLETIETYQEVLTSRRLLQVAEDNLEVLRGFADQIEERTSSGAGSASDNLTARSRVADAETRRIDARARLDRAEAAYRRLFGSESGGLPAPVAAPSLPESEAEVIDQSPRLRRVNASLKAAEADVIAAEARRRLPAVELGATGQRASGGGLDVGLDFTLNYSLDTRGQRDAALEAAEARLSAIESERDMLVRDVREALAFVRSDRKTGVQRVRAARQAVETNVASVEASKEQFRIGRRRMIDLLDAQRDLVRARETLIMAEQERFLTDYAALALTGDILDVFAISLSEVAQ